MPLKETHIKTDYLDTVLHRNVNVPVRITDELIATSLTHLVFTPVGKLGDVLAGYFTNNADIGKWYFSNARRHGELQLAVEPDLGSGLDYFYGNLMISQAALHNGDLQFDSFLLRTAHPGSKAEKQLFDVIDPEYFTKTFRILRK